MISNDILDRLLPIPTAEQLMNRAQSELAASGFPITNFKTGGIAYTLLKIVFQVHIELVQLSRKMLNNGFVSHAAEGWLELKAYDYSKARKQPTKAQGFVTLTRSSPFPAVRITKGHVFKSGIDDNGDELRYICTADTIFKVGQTSLQVPVEAEQAGSQYNVPQGTITKTLIHIESVDSITNASDWLTSEGSDLEEIEAFRARVLNSWAELATTPTRDKYKSVCEAIPGVLFVRVDDLHPRGQGTIDIIVTSTAGAATEALLTQVQAACERIRGPYDNLLIKSSVTVPQDITVVLQISSHVSEDGLIDKAHAILADMLRTSRDRNLNELLRSDIIYYLRAGIPTLRNVQVITPIDDVLLEVDKVITAGTLTITIERL